MSKVIVVLVLVAACTKPNPNRCCTDEADCNAAGIPVGSTCEAGLVCRGNQCISQPCSASSECDASAPYCTGELCAESCNDDLQCPGFGQTAADRFCVEGACRECRVGMMDDCGVATPVCDQGACRACEAHGECKSGVCGDDGHCIDESSISYVETSGSMTSDCTRVSPCSTLSRALTLTKPFVLIGPGTYSTNAALMLVGQRQLIGSGSPPVLTRSTGGPIVTITSGQIKLENMQVSGATRGTSDGGNGVFCNASGGAPSVRLHRMHVRDNVDSGVETVSCLVTATESVFTNNGRGSGGSGLRIINGTGTVDRCVLMNNDVGMDLDSGLYQVTNSFIMRNDSSTNASFGINLYSTEAGNRIEFNTIIDNANSAPVGHGLNCNLQGVTASFPNNIIARNKLQTGGSNCTYPSSIIADSDISGLKFGSPDAPPYDYHISAGSTAIDAATASTVDHDFDGQPRTAPRDVGADEFVP